jgi:HEAT repeat protein
MCKRAKRWAVAVALVVAFSVGLAGTVRAAQGDNKELLDKFKQGVTYYQTGEYDKAKEAFSAVLAMKPGMEAALEMRDNAELQEFVKMRDVPQIGQEADQLLRLMVRAERQSRRTVENVDKLLADFRGGDLLIYGKARVELRSHGPYVVPFLIGMLASDKPEDQVTVGRTVSLLVSLHPDAVLPLSEVLANTDDSLVAARVAGVLGQIGAPGAVRALPALMKVWAAAGTLPSTRQAAADAIQAIAGKAPAAMPSAADQYLDLGQAYLFEDTARVGFTYGLNADVWVWNGAGKDWPDKIACEEVPAYFYYQRMAADTALVGLTIEARNQYLQSLLAAALVRQLTLCEYFKAADMPAGEEDMAEKIHSDAAARADKLGGQVPMVLSLMETPQVSGALLLTLQASDEPASLYLEKAIGMKLDAGTGQTPDQTTTDALISSLSSGDKDVRYNAAVTLVKSCPTGACGSTDEIMAVMGAAIRAATQRTALIIMRDFQTMNSLVSVVRGADVATVESRPDKGQIDYMLSLEPSVDIVFLTGNVSDGVMSRMMELLKTDVRTKAAPIYVVVDPTQPAADLTPYTEIQKVLSPDHIRAAVIGPILKEKVVATSHSALTEQQQALVLKAIQALAQVDPGTTKYDCGALEPGLIAGASGYSDEVTAAVVGALGRFGSQAALPALTKIVSGDKPAALKAAACSAAASVLKRTSGPAPQDLVAALKATLAAKEPALRLAAAEALSVAGLNAQDRLSLIQTEALAK